MGKILSLHLEYKFVIHGNHLSPAWYAVQGADFFFYKSLISSKLGLYVLKFVGHRFWVFTFSR